MNKVVLGPTNFQCFLINSEFLEKERNKKCKILLWNQIVKNRNFLVKELLWQKIKFKKAFYVSKNICHFLSYELKVFHET